MLVFVSFLLLVCWCADMALSLPGNTLFVTCRNVWPLMAMSCAHKKRACLKEKKLLYVCVVGVKGGGGGGEGVMP